MVPTTSDWTRVTARKVAMAALMGVAVTLVGCGGDDEDAAKIRQAKIDMQTLAATYQPGQSGGKASYEKVISSLDKAAQSTEPGEATAARLIRAQAYMRQGDEAAAQAAVEERSSHRIAQAARAQHDRWHNLQAQATALEQYDPKGDIAKIDEQIAARDAEIAQTKTELAKAEQELAALRQGAEEAQAKSQAKRDSEMSIRGRMIDKSQVERAELVKQANNAKREGDAFDLQAADLLAQMGRQQPAIAELQTKVQRLEAHKLVLGASRQNAVAAAEQARQQAQRTRDGVVSGGKVELVGAKQVGEELTGTIAALKEARAKLDAPTDNATGLYDKALGEVSKAKGGGGAARGGGDTRLIEASVHHARADLFLSRGNGLASHAALMKLLGESEPKLPSAAEYASAAKEASTAAAAMMESAKEEFTKARTLYTEAGQSQKAQDVKDRLEQIATALLAFGAKGEAPADQGGETPATDGGNDVATVPAAGGKPEGTPPGDQAPVTPASFSAEQAAVLALAEKISGVMKKHEYDNLMPLMVFRNSKQEEIFKKVTPIFAKDEALDAACVERFGRTFEELLLELGENVDNSMNRGERELARLRTLDPNDLEITILPGGTDAEMRFKSARAAAPLEAMKVGDEWKLKLDFEYEGAMASDGFIAAIGKALDTVTENIKAGKYGTDAQKMVNDVVAQLMKAMADAIKPPSDENK
jgi:hypothetical protein